MLVPFVVGTGPENPTGLMQAWGGALCAQKQGILYLDAVLSENNPRETIEGYWPQGILSYDGGIIIIGSGGNVFVFLGPPSGLREYIAQAIIGTHAVADAEAQAWLYTIWSSMSLDIIGQIQARVQGALSPTGVVQLAGLSADSGTPSGPFKV